MSDYDIKLYAHGVPNGQKTWGVSESDSTYIDSFYGRESEASVQMLVEVRRFGTNTNCYYTYLRLNNINDKSGRAGSYFALTLRINYYYADIQNIYNLLDAAYNKFILGSALTTSNGVSNYLISDFSELDSRLAALEKEIRYYLMQFSSDSDFIPLDRFKANGQSEVVNFNLLECEPKIVAGHIKTHGHFSVSPQYLSHREQTIIQKTKVEIDRTKADATQQIADAKQRTNAALQKAQREKEEGIQAVRNEYKDADKTIDALNQKISKANDKIKELQADNSVLEKQRKAALQYQAIYEKAKELFGEMRKVPKSLLESLSGLLNKLTAESGGDAHNSSSEHQSGGSGRNGKISRHKKIGKKLYILLRDLFEVTALAVILGFTIPNGCSGADGNNKELLALKVVDALGFGKNPEADGNNEELLKEQIESLRQELDTTKASLTKSKSQLNDFISHLRNATRIDVEGISDKMPMKKSQPYRISLRPNGKEINLGRQWTSDDFDISGDTIRPKHAGDCTIKYMVNGNVLKTREFDVKEQ